MLTEEIQEAPQCGRDQLAVIAAPPTYGLENKAADIARLQRVQSKLSGTQTISQKLPCYREAMDKCDGAEAAFLDQELRVISDEQIYRPTDRLCGNCGNEIHLA
jgi:hypothetical protein